MQDKNYYNKIKDKLIDDEIYSKVKDYSKERHRVITYFEVGKILSEAGKHYGEGIIKEYSIKLSNELGKKYSYRTLNYMVKFYNLQKMQSLIKLKEYERLPNSTKIKLIENKNQDIKDLIKNPIIIRNKNNYEIISEKVLQKIILEDIPSFLKELGDSFTFIDNEYKIKIGDNYNYIDLLLYNIKYKCYVVIELKVTELKKEYIGQIQTYMNYIDKNLKSINEDKTIGIIICKKDNKFIMEYCSDERILSNEYQIV